MTRELLSHQDDRGPLWRVSVADITGDCAFSMFAGFDRTTVLLSGTGLTLTFPQHGLLENQPMALDHAHPIVCYPGDIAPTCRLIGAAPAQVLNIMTARGRASVSSAIVTGFDGEAGPTLVWCLAGSIAWAGGDRFGVGEGLYGDDLPELDGDAVLLAARFSVDR